MEAVQPVVITSTNEDYVLPLSVMLHTLQDTLTRNTKVKVYVLQHRLSEASQNLIHQIINPSLISLAFVEVEDHMLRPLKIDGHISIETYYRLLVEKLFPFLDKVIYLDADLVINSSISQLWNYEFADALLLAVPHASKESGYASGARGLPSHLIIGIPAQTRLFNAGVMVINLAKWRKFDVSNRIISYLHKYKEYVLWWDQDGLNAILYNKWRALPPTWNVMTSHLALFSSFSDSLLNAHEFETVLADPDIIHYSGPVKPWMPHYNGAFADVFNGIASTFTSYRCETIR